MADQLHMPTSLSLVLRGLRCCFEPRTRQDRIASLGARLVVRRGKITRAAQLAGRISQIARESPEVHYPLGMLGGKVVLRCRFTLVGSLFGVERAICDMLATTREGCVLETGYAPFVMRHLLCAISSSAASRAVSS